MPSTRTRWTIAEERDDGRWFAPSAERNAAPILDVLRRVLPASGKVLEIGSGTGQHAAYFAGALPQIVWQPTEADAGFLGSIERWAAATGARNLLPPMILDVMRVPWPIEAADALVAINVVHVAPAGVVAAIFEGAHAILPKGGVVVLYGPYRRLDRATAESNEKFDASLRAHDPRWGLRQVEDVVRTAAPSGFSLEDAVDMPAHNTTLVLRHT